MGAIRLDGAGPTQRVYAQPADASNTRRPLEAKFDKIEARYVRTTKLAKAARLPFDTSDTPTAKKVRLARIEYLLEILRSSHVTDGFQFNENDAARVLRYFQKCSRWKAAREPDRAEFRFALDFVYNHGQSSDWIFIGNLAPMTRHAAALSPRLPRRTKPHLAVVR